jgi:hypothetical protein
MSAASAASPDAPQLKPGANGLWRIEGNWTAQGLGKTPPPTPASTEQEAVPRWTGVR